MTDKPTYQDRLRSMLNTDRMPSDPQRHEVDADDLEASPGAAFGYLRGIRDTASAVEFRFRNGTSRWFPYSWLGPWQYDPSEGLLLKFSGDLTYLVLIKGSNLDLPLKAGGPNLTSGGLQRQRVLWIREMTKEDINNIGEKAPTIDSIEVAELESPAEVKEWLKENAQGFLA
jgi:hypothetical protein